MVQYHHTGLHIGSCETKKNPSSHGYIVWLEPDLNQAEPGTKRTKPSEIHRYSTVNWCGMGFFKLFGIPCHFIRPNHTSSWLVWLDTPQTKWFGTIPKTLLLAISSNMVLISSSKPYFPSFNIISLKAICFSSRKFHNPVLGFLILKSSSIS